MYSFNKILPLVVCTLSHTIKVWILDILTHVIMSTTIIISDITKVTISNSYGDF